MTTPLLVHRDGRGMQWRLALDDKNTIPLVVLERLETIFGEPAWTHVRIVTSDLAKAGVRRFERNVIMLSDLTCRALFEVELRAQGVEIEAPAAVAAHPPPPIRNVLLLAAELDRSPFISFSTGLSAAAARKLREAFYLLQDVNHLVTVFKAALVGPPPDTLSSWIEVILHRCSVFPSMSLAEPLERPPELPVERAPLTREQAGAIARKHAGPRYHDLAHPWVIDAIIEASK